jgi:hypothetical protein
MDTKSLGWMLMIGGGLAVALGWMVASGWLDWFGRLPGDLRFASDRTRIYIPFTSMLLVSVVLTIVVNVWRRL